jgi:hypothetical protein
MIVTLIASSMPFVGDFVSICGVIGFTPLYYSLLPPYLNFGFFKVLYVHLEILKIDKLNYFYPYFIKKFI